MAHQKEVRDRFHHEWRNLCAGDNNPSGPTRIFVDAQRLSNFWRADFCFFANLGNAQRAVLPRDAKPASTVIPITIEPLTVRLSEFHHGGVEEARKRIEATGETVESEVARTCWHVARYGSDTSRGEVLTEVDKRYWFFVYGLLEAAMDLRSVKT